MARPYLRVVADWWTHPGRNDLSGVLEAPADYVLSRWRRCRVEVANVSTRVSLSAEGERAGVEHLPARRLLSTDEAAEYLGVSPRHLRQLWSERRIAGIRIGRLIRFDPCDLDGYIARRRVEAVR